MPVSSSSVVRIVIEFVYLKWKQEAAFMRFDAPRFALDL